MTVHDLVQALEAIAPPAYAEPWDRVGLLVGSLDKPVRGPVLFTIDLTEPVLAEAKEAEASAIVAYHPVIWEPLKRLTGATPTQRIVLHAAELGIAIYCPHTALDAVPGGICDWLCEGLSGAAPGKIAGDCRALRAHSAGEPTQEVKIVTFAPAGAVETIRSALATAGAGIIGNYRVCSFTSSGTGTFLGGAGSTPKVGKPGALESVEEARVEMVCSKAALALALKTLRQFHPYEEPAVDVYELLPKPQRDFGPGRRLHLDHPATVPELAQRLKTFLGAAGVRYADAHPGTPVSTVGVCAGSGNDLAPVARAEGCEVYVTGEMGHHHVLAALHSGMSVILAEHTTTERGYLPRLAEALAIRLLGLQTIISRADKDPLTPI